MLGPADEPRSKFHSCVRKINRNEIRDTYYRCGEQIRPLIIHVFVPYVCCCAQHARTKLPSRCGATTAILSYYLIRRARSARARTLAGSGRQRHCARVPIRNIPSACSDQCVSRCRRARQPSRKYSSHARRRAATNMRMNEVGSTTRSAQVSPLGSPISIVEVAVWLGINHVREALA